MYKQRQYRVSVHNKDLISFKIEHFESDLLICAEKNIESQAKQALVFYHQQVQEYVQGNPLFGHSLVPLSLDKKAPLIIRQMYQAAKKAKVGPMATVAGAIAQSVGQELIKLSPQIIVENGGDIFICTQYPRKIGIFAGIGCVYNQLVFNIASRQTPCGICASSGTFGHSLSLGNSSATIVIADSCAVADGFATAIGNLIKSDDDLEKAVKIAKKQALIKGLIVITSSKLTAYGDVEFDVLDNKT
ncbi:MAG: UPF0280 family protein [Candidatus Omnitrophica bacterium]|nr:UPF0280 family protein [Candidatus Omnitrophota bacterium]